jgi:hypothetical protein
MVSCPKDVRSFLGLAGAYRKFVPKFALMALPLFDLLNVKQPAFDAYMETNGDRVAKAMQDLKNALTTNPCLSLPDPNNHEYLVRTDASDFGIGATLRQMQPKEDDSQSIEERILAYSLESYTGQRYDTQHMTKNC